MRPVLFACVLLSACHSETTDPVATTDAAVDVHEAGHDAADARVEVTPDIPPPKVPATLAETGLYADFASKSLAPGVRAYDVRHPLWSDGAEKQRYLFVPAGKTIDTTDVDAWVFPTGTKAWKEFRVDGKLVETRYVEKTGEPPIGWRYAAYVWSADGSTAKAAEAGATAVLGTSHDVPDQAACENCHSGTRDGIVGVNALQVGNTLSELLDKPLASDPVVPGTGVVQEVLGYLHGNCGYCHSDRGRWATVRPLRLHVPVGLTDPTKAPAYVTTIDKPMGHLDVDGNPLLGVVPGDASKSHLYYRMIKRDFWAMPPVGSKLVDDAACAKVKTWIESL